MNLKQIGSFDRLQLTKPESHAGVWPVQHVTLSKASHIGLHVPITPELEELDDELELDDDELELDDELLEELLELEDELELLDEELEPLEDEIFNFLVHKIKSIVESIARSCCPLSRSTITWFSLA